MTNKIEEAIPRQENGRFRGLILTGRAGIGKTSALMDLASDDGVGFCRIPMASRTAEDFGVYPVPDKVDSIDAEGNKSSHWEIAQPLIESQLAPFLKQNIGNGYGVILLDDVTLADPRLQSGLLELVQFGRIGDFDIGPNVLIAMTGNGIEDGCHATEWNKALLGRSLLVEYEPDFDKWIQLPCNTNIDPSVVGFLKSFGQFFAPHADDEKVVDENGKCPSPRDWTSLGIDIAKKHGGGRNFKPNVLFETLPALINAMIGKKAGAAFSNFMSIIMKYPSAEEILKDASVWTNVSLEKKNNKGAVYSIAYALSSTVIGMNDKINDNDKMTKKAKQTAKEDLVKSFVHAVAALMEQDREMGAFCIRYILTHTKDNDEIGGVVADYCYNVNDIDPILRNSGIDKVMANIKDVSQGLSGR